MKHTLDKFFTRISTWIADAAGQPATFILAMATVIVWAVTGPMFAFSETWQLVINTGTTIVTFLMVFLIQNSANRDTASMQAKLDELLRAVEGAREKFIGIEHLTSHEVEAVRAALEKETNGEKGEAVDESLKKLAAKL
ncbi:low affinity iron permease family protein [Sphingomonas sp. SUN039]|uniref:low affinity iron permease family protein n=1 Tax=Sphingomonas sp. SUN039 TaxID=2937787 RepID=UPI002164EB6A|nr:low affinity iron permease family protein [Sphingomonas sp. SUN039]UVO54669.1 low affinity iron permease family protein [Sphingomonas sp. SUN039]